MKVWEYIKKPQTLFNQPFAAFPMNIFYTFFYARLVKDNVSNGLGAF